MKMIRYAILAISHVLTLVVGIGLGIYMLPILIAPKAPSTAEIAKVTAQTEFTASFTRERQDSDALHWGEGKVVLSADAIGFMGELAPGPDYKLYLSPRFVETEADFNALKSQMVRVGDVKTFENFLLPLPQTVALSQYNTVVIWCETFGQFITSGQYRE
ncbi:DM13 domain-containing protein [Motilimonas pumila]|uniref:DM13 domain-containing protein n=1 Tax=Motilimonas pumila TaxID=2303987 RepID=A0A418YEJ7_9GAMM|nr:DM13 domain-containing protein [Motilimonas pumila]RJG47562.1 hypothetical protein D1Z90_10520 [Motilimonas pumila]